MRSTLKSDAPTNAATANTGRAAFARLGSRPIPRVTRMMDVARSLGYETLFLAARRDEALAESEIYAEHNVKRIGPFFPLLNGRSGWLYISSVVKYNHALLRELKRVKPTIVHCSDIETIPAGVFFKWRSGTRLIYNIHDNLAQRYNFPGWVQEALNVLEGIAVRLSSTALVPESFRRDTLPRWCRSKVSVVRNTPADRGVFPPPVAATPIRLFFGGWLDDGRGLRELLALVRQNNDFELTLAGEGALELVREIESTPRTRYLGFVTHDKIMEETSRAHVVTALYDPMRPINRYAASNKLAEALACGRPVLVNSEMLITQSLAEHNCLVALPYANLRQDAARMLRSLLEDGGAAYRAKCAAARTAYEQLYTWEVAQKAMAGAIQGT
jgi:glycosyltransferase involved in cell wall biosynthesis